MLFSRSESSTGVRESCEMVWTVRKRKLYDFLTYSSKNTKKKSEWESEEKFRVLRGLSRMLEMFSAVVVVLRGKSGFRGVICTHWERISIEKLLLSGTWEIFRYFSYSDPWSAHRITQEIFVKSSWESVYCSDGRWLVNFFSPQNVCLGTTAQQLYSGVSEFSAKCKK